MMLQNVAKKAPERELLHRVHLQRLRIGEEVKHTLDYITIPTHSFQRGDNLTIVVFLYIDLFMVLK